MSVVNDTCIWKFETRDMGKCLFENLKSTMFILGGYAKSGTTLYYILGNISKGSNPKILCMNYIFFTIVIIMTY